MDEIKMRYTCFSGVAVYGDIKVCENNHGELIKKHCNYKNIIYM